MTALNPAALKPVTDSLREALSFHNDDTECLFGQYHDAAGIDDCADNRCRDHGCMVARVNRWRAALALAEQPLPVTSSNEKIDGRCSDTPDYLGEGDVRSKHYHREEDTVDHDS